jgi:hypothetical protein
MPPTPDSQNDRARNLLRPDNYELFDEVRDRLNQRDPVIPIDGVAAWLGVTVDELCRWIIKFSEKKRPKSIYQSKAFAPLAQPRQSGATQWADDQYRQRQRIAQRARDGARAAREALGQR